MSKKVLGRSGFSIPDTYDIRGSKVDIQDIDAANPPLVHELGATIFMERLSMGVFILETGNVAQSTNFDVTFALADVSVARVLAVEVVNDAVGQTAHANVALRDDPAEREIGIWTWDATNDAEHLIRRQLQGAAISNMGLLRPNAQVQVPSLMLGLDHRDPVNMIAFRGATTAFGAGNMTFDCQVLLAFSHEDGINSFGVPIPGW